MDKETILNMVRQRIVFCAQQAEEARSIMLAALGAVQELRQLAAKFESMQELPPEAAPKEGVDVDNPISS